MIHSWAPDCGSWWRGTRLARVFPRLPAGFLSSSALYASSVKRYLAPAFQVHGAGGYRALCLRAWLSMTMPTCSARLVGSSGLIGLFALDQYPPLASLPTRTRYSYSSAARRRFRRKVFKHVAHQFTSSGWHRSREKRGASCAAGLRASPDGRRAHCRNEPLCFEIRGSLGCSRVHKELEPVFGGNLLTSAFPARR